MKGYVGMVKARSPSKGATYLAKERGLIRPRFTTSCASLFADDGNPWLSSRDRNEEFPLSHSREGVVISPEQKKRSDIYERARSKLEAQGVQVPPPMPDVAKPSLVVDPDFDAYFAERAKAPKSHQDEPGKPVKTDHARWRANLLQKTRMAMASACVNVKEQPVKPEKNFGVGTRYYFDAPEMTDEKLRKIRSKRNKGRKR